MPSRVRVRLLWQVALLPELDRSVNSPEEGASLLKLILKTRQAVEGAGGAGLMLTVMLEFADKAPSDAESWRI